MSVRFDAERQQKDAEPFKFSVDTVAICMDQTRSVDELRSCLLEMRDLFSLKHVSYQGWLTASMSAAPSLTLTTYSSQWVKEYESHHVFDWDPIAKAARQSVLPINWDRVDWSTSDAQRYRLMLKRHAVGATGLTVPVHGPRGTAALLSFTGPAAGEVSWEEFYRQREAEFAMLALKVHDRALSLAGTFAPPTQMRLTPKVTSCLELLAQGRKPAEIGAELGLSVHTVRKHLDRAVTDLSCQTKAQAITRALTLGLIRLGSASILHLNRAGVPGGSSS